MNSQLKKALNLRAVDFDGIYAGMTLTSTAQSIEVELRERVAAQRYDNYLDGIIDSHSIPVMDYEVRRFLEAIPQGGLILDVGGCRGWHWRFLEQTRPDVGVLIVDFVRQNLQHARNLLGSLIGKQVVLMHADATALPFTIDDKFAGFDGIWTVQTFQHIPDFDNAVSEAFRVLKSGGLFANYSLNVQPPIRWLRRLLGKGYLTKGRVEGSFWLARASQEQKRSMATIFGSKVSERWSEILYSPELRFTLPGKQWSGLGKLDALLSNNTGILCWFARQRSFHCQKP